MWIPRSLACLLLLAVAAAGAIPVNDAESEETGLLAITTTDDKGRLEGTNVVFFTGGSCKDCKEAEGVFLKAASFAHTQEKSPATSHLAWSRINCDKRGELCAKYEIAELPLIAVIADGKIIGRVKNWKNTEPKQMARTVESILTLKATTDGPGLASIPKDVEVKVESSSESDTAKDDSEHDAVSAASLTATATAQASRVPAPPAPIKAAGNNKENDKSEEEEESPIEALTAKTYNEKHMKGLWIVKYFSPYCPHCVHFAPVYIDIFNKLGGDEGTAKLGVHMSDVNCVEEGDICGKAGISGIPAILAYMNGKKIASFDGDRNFQDITDWIKKLADEHGEASKKANEANEDKEEMEAKDDKDASDVKDSAEHGAEDASKKTPVKDETAKGAASNSQISGWTKFKASYSSGKSKPLTPSEYKALVSESFEPWMIKFYSPRCPHCIEMAPKWKEFASNVKGHINVGEVNCMENAQFCIELGIKAYPTLRFVRGSTTSIDYDVSKGYHPSKFEEFARKGSASQLLPINSVDDFMKIALTNNKRFVSTFIYFHDEAIVSEDIAALAEINEKISNMRAVVYACDNKEVREYCGIKHALTGLTLIHWPDVNAARPVTYTIRNGFIPEVFRDVKKSVEWIKNMRLSTMQLVNAKTIKDVLEFGKYAVIYVLDSGHKTVDAMAERSKILEINTIVAELFKTNLARQKDTQGQFRASKKDAMGLLAKLGKLDSVHDVYKTKVDIPAVIDVAFVMGTQEELAAGLKKSLDMSKFQPGDIIVGDFREGKYAAEWNNEKITTAEHMLETLYAWANDANVIKKKSFRPLKGMRDWSIPRSEVDISRFVPNDADARSVRKKAIIKTIVIIVLASILGISALAQGYKLYRRRRTGPILDGKLD